MRRRPCLHSQFVGQITYDWQAMRLSLNGEYNTGYCGADTTYNHGRPEKLAQVGKRKDKSNDFKEKENQSLPGVEIGVLIVAHFYEGNKAQERDIGHYRRHAAFLGRTGSLFGIFKVRNIASSGKFLFGITMIKKRIGHLSSRSQIPDYLFSKPEKTELDRIHLGPFFQALSTIGDTNAKIYLAPAVREKQALF